MVISDDMEWVRWRLLPRVGSAAVYPVGDGRWESQEMSDVAM